MRRPRRNRKSETIRSLVREHQVTVNDLVFPLFVTDGQQVRHEVSSMPGIFRLSKDLIVQEVGACIKLGLKTFILFPHVHDSLKDSLATESYNPNSTYIQTIRAIPVLWLKGVKGVVLWLGAFRKALVGFALVVSRRVTLLSWKLR